LERRDWMLENKAELIMEPKYPPKRSKVQ